MATAIRRLELKVGELIEIDGRRYEVVPTPNGDGVTLEPSIKSMAELEREWGSRPVSQAEFDRLSADLPSDGEG